MEGYCTHNLNRLLLFAVLLVAINASGQSSSPDFVDDEAAFEKPTTALWLGNYGTFRISDRFFVTGEFHLRRAQHKNTRYIGKMSKIYNRWGIQYNHSKKFNATLGGVLRLDFTPDPDNDDLRTVVLEPRIWHQYIFAVPFDRFMVYHRLRLEHRWSTNHAPGSEWIYRNRYRYMFLMKIPLNNSKLEPGTFYAYPNIELIMQNGDKVSSSAVEDLRLFSAIGYIYNPRVSFSAGMMYTTGQRLTTGNLYRTRWVARFNMYISLDFRKFEERIPQIGIQD